MGGKSFIFLVSLHNIILFPPLKIYENNLFSGCWKRQPTFFKRIIIVIKNKLYAERNTEITAKSRVEVL